MDIASGRLGLVLGGKLFGAKRCSVAVNASKGIVHFEAFELDLRTAELRKDGAKPVRLPEQPFRILSMLLEHPREVVSREEIRKKLWPNDTIVESEHSISAAMNRLRQALSDSADNPRYIETLARRGYRLIVPVEWVGPAGPPAGVAPGLAPATPIASAVQAAAVGSGSKEEPQTLKDRSALPSSAGLASLTGKKA